MAGTGRAPVLNVTANAAGELLVLRAGGVLDSSSYIALRDKIIDAALHEPSAVVVDVTDLVVPADSAWLVFSSARWLVSRWPRIPIALVCEHTETRDALTRSGVPRRVPVYPSIDSAVGCLPSGSANPMRHRARADLAARVQSLRRSRELVAGWLTAWSRAEFIPVTNIVATTLVENVLQHTDSRPCVRLESDDVVVAVAVEDSSHAAAALREDATETGAPSGLRIMAAVCRMWGQAPTPAGKTVWAVIGRENLL
jgi:hypothetical protein